MTSLSWMSVFTSSTLKTFIKCWSPYFKFWICPWNVNFVLLCWFSLCEKCPNTEFFLVRIFLYFDWIRENMDQKNSLFGHFSHSVYVRSCDKFSHQTSGVFELIGLSQAFWPTRLIKWASQFIFKFWKAI